MGRKRMTVVLACIAALFAVVLGIVLGKSTFGRKVYAIGTNRLAARYAARLTGPEADRWKAEGLAPFLDAYRACCVNLGRTVTFEGGSGTCVQVDEEGRLTVATDAGEQCVFTGEVSVKGIYEQLSAR